MHIFSRRPNKQPYSLANSRAKEPRGVGTIQTKLAIGKANDPLEQEADKVADRVVNQPGSGPPPSTLQKETEEELQAKPQAQILKQVDEEEVQAKPNPEIQKREDDEEIVQTKAEDEGAETASADVAGLINTSRGSGSPLPYPVRENMENGIGADFGKVRIHTDNRAQDLNAKLNAQAFTVGNDVYFNKGKYNPESRSGKHLLAHELTHTVQQGASIHRMIQKQSLEKEEFETDSQGYTYGREPHQHKGGDGRWDKVQEIEAENCLSTPKLSVRYAMSCLCSVNQPEELIRQTFIAEMIDKPLARKHLSYYLNGSGKELNVDESVMEMFMKDEGVRALLKMNIQGGMRNSVFSGNFMIRQSTYAIEDFQKAFGGIDRVDWLVHPGHKFVEVWFKDPYDFHPVYPGLYDNLGDGADAMVRDTNCLHAALIELTEKNGTIDRSKFVDLMQKMGIEYKYQAKPFIMRGKAIIPLEYILI